MSPIITYVINLIIGGAFGYLMKRVRENSKRTTAVEAGVQALLRDRMIQSYNKHYLDKGYMPLYEKENFINIYNAYHNLGVNGVMDDIKDKILSLPTTKKE